MKFKMTTEVKRELPIKVLEELKDFIESLVEEKYVGNFREERPVDRKERLLVVVHPKDGNRLGIYSGLLDANNKFELLGRKYETTMNLEKIIRIDCSFGRTYNMLTIA